MYRVIFEKFSAKLKGKVRFEADLSKTNWFGVGGKAEILFIPESKEDLKNGQLYGFEYKAGPAEGLKSAKNGSPIEWTLENNTDQSLELRCFDFDVCRFWRRRRRRCLL
jgi:hypothetical protein